MGNEKSLEEDLMLELRKLDPDIGELTSKLYMHCNFLLYTSELLTDSDRSLMEQQFLLLIDKANNIGN